MRIKPPKSAKRCAELLKSMGRESILSYEWLRTGKKDLGAELERADRKCLKSLLLLTLIFALAAVLLPAQEPRQLTEIARPGHGSAALELDLKARIESADGLIEADTPFEIEPAELTEEGAEEIFLLCEEWLRKTVKGGSESLDKVSGDLFFPDRWEDEEVLLSWQSLDPGILKDDGSLRLWGREDGTLVRAECVMMTDRFSKEVIFEFILMPSLADPSFALAAEARAAAAAASAQDSDVIMLPSELEGEPVTWMSVSGAVIPQAALMFIAAAALMWAGRYSGLKERLRKEAAEFEDQIEEVMTQLVLLLDAGLVVSAALDRIAAPEGRERGPLFRAMADIKEECDRSNASFIQSFYSYSITTGSRELIRFASLIRDGSLRGSGLSQKLSAESGRMHDSRLNRAKGKARELETRLCMPLMLLLISLLAIAAGPVLIGM